MLESKESKPSIYQVLLLANDNSDDVKVQESEQVDFFQVKTHLKNGGSVFITSIGSQKLKYAKSKAQFNYSKSRKAYGFLFRNRLRRI